MKIHPNNSLKFKLNTNIHIGDEGRIFNYKLENEEYLIWWYDNGIMSSTIYNKVNFDFNLTVGNWIKI